MSTALHFMRWLGVLLTLLAVWPMAHALQALADKDYLAGSLLLALTYVIARSGVELAQAERKDMP